MPTKRQLRERAREEEPLSEELNLNEQPKDEKPKDEKPKDEQPIVRKTAVAWWCPECGHSMEIRLQKCAKCGAIKEGNIVRK